MPTPEEIDAMPAGPELDQLVAELVMGATWNESFCRVCGWKLVAEGEAGCWASNCSMRPPPVNRADAPEPYSVDIAAAWEVIEKLAIHLKGESGNWTCCMMNGNHKAKASTAPLAICRAALKAVS